MNSRTERDSFGTIEVPANHFWDAQTQRSLLYFHISTERMTALDDLSESIAYFATRAAEKLRHDGCYTTEWGELPVAS